MVCRSVIRDTATGSGVIATVDPVNGTWNAEARLSWVLAALAGLVGAAAFTHSAGYFVTFMTGNTERGILYFFDGEVWLAVSALLLIATFLTGVVVASVCRRRVWSDHPHGATVLTTASLVVATAVDVVLRGWSGPQVEFVPILFVAFGMGALNCSFVKNGEVSVPLTYVTGTLVKMGQGIERHLTGGGTVHDWAGYALLYLAFGVGAVVGGFVSLAVSGAQMLAAAALVCAATTVYTYRRADEEVPLLG